MKYVHRFARLGVPLEDSPNGLLMVHQNSHSSLVVEVKFKQHLDPLLMELKELLLGKLNESFSRGGSVLRYQGRLCRPDVEDFRNQIAKEAYDSRCSLHPGTTKMYHDIREVYWWDGLKRNIAEFAPKCPNYQQVKVVHLKPGGLAKIMDVPTCKWETINVGFVVGLSRTRKK